MVKGVVAKATLGEEAEVEVVASTKEVEVELTLKCKQFRLKWLQVSQSHCW